MATVVNETKGTVVVRRLQHATTFWSRFKGLMLKDGLPDGEGLLIEPSGSIHTAFMRFPIDVVFLSKDGKVVKVVREIKPWRAALSGGHGALELPAGSAKRARVEEGDWLAFLEERSEN